MARIGGGGRGYSANVFFYNVLLFAREGSILSVHCACILYRWWEEDIWLYGKFFARFSKHRRLEVIQFSRIILSLGRITMIRLCIRYVELKMLSRNVSGY